MMDLLADLFGGLTLNYRTYPPVLGTLELRKPLTNAEALAIWWTVRGHALTGSPIRFKTFLERNYSRKLEGIGGACFFGLWK
jgi:hypothetical protein